MVAQADAGQHTRGRTWTSGSLWASGSRMQNPPPLLCQGLCYVREPEARGSLGCPYLASGQGYPHPVPEASASVVCSGGVHLAAWKQTFPFKGPLTGKASRTPREPAAPQPASPPRHLGSGWKTLTLYPETASCITYRSELFIIPPSVQ